MAWNIVSANLNTKGDNGHFETDPSTWGIGYDSGFTISRSSIYKKTGSNSYQVRNTGVTPAGSGRNAFCSAHLPFAIAGKKYLVRSWMRTNSTDGSTGRKFGNDDLAISLHPFNTPPVNLIEQNIETIATIKNNDGSFVKIEAVYECTANRNLIIFELTTTPNFKLTAPITPVEPVASPIIWIDDFEIYEVEGISESCTIGINLGTTVIGSASGPSAADGFINVGVTAGIPPYDYSKDDGVTWQLTNQFPGLLPDVYWIRVRERATPGCYARQSFAVNTAAPAFDFTVAIKNESVLGASDGELTVTVTGSGAPWTMRIGTGAYASVNIFSNLAPGTYTITVRDHSGNRIAKSFTIIAGPVAFEKMWFSRNPITYPSSYPGFGTKVNPRVYDDVRVEEVNGSGIFISALKTDLPPESNSNVVFSVRQAFRDLLKAIPPSLNTATIDRLTDRVKIFKHFTGLLEDDQVTPDEELTVSLPHQVMLGGLSKYANATIDFFGSYLPTNKKFMSWAPLQKQVDKNQEDYLTYYVFSLSTKTLKLFVNAFYDDGTTQGVFTITKSGVNYGQLYQIPVGPGNCGVQLINPAKNLVKYEITIRDQANAIVSEVRTYIIDPITHPRKRLFMFLNSLGSYEVLRFTGGAENNTDISKDEIVKFLPYNYSALNGEREINHATIRNSGSYSSGYLHGSFAKEWQDYFKDLLLSRQVYDVTDGQRRKINISGGSFPMDADQDFERYIRFTAADTFEDENYTPAL